MQVRTQTGPMISMGWEANKQLPRGGAREPFTKASPVPEDVFDRVESAPSALSVSCQEVISVESDAPEKPTTWLGGAWSAVKEFFAGLARPYRQVAQVRSSNPVRRAEGHAVAGDVFTDSSNHLRSMVDYTGTILKLFAHTAVAALSGVVTGLSGLYGFSTAVQAQTAFGRSDALRTVKTQTNAMTETRMFAEQQQERLGVMKMLASAAAALQFVGGLICMGTKSKTQMQIEKAKDALMKGLDSKNPRERNEAKAILKALGILSSSVTAESLLKDPKHAGALLDTKLQGAASWSI